MGSESSQSQRPLKVTEALAQLLAFYVAGSGLQQFSPRKLRGDAFNQEADASLGVQGIDQSTGNPLFGDSQFNVNPQALISGQGGVPQAGNIPGTILPNFNNLLNLSNRSFFGSLNPGILAQLNNKNNERQ